MASFIYPGLQTFIDPLTGDVLANGTVELYVPGTTVDKLTYSDPDGSTENDNPIQLDANGQCAIWGTGLYRQILKRADGTQIWDRVTKVNPVTRPTVFSTLGVHFDSQVRLENTSLTATDNASVSWFYWINFNIPSPGGYEMWNADQNGVNNDSRVTGNGGVDTRLIRSLNLTSSSFTAYVDAHSPDAANNNSWHPVLISASLDGSGFIKIYVDDVDVTTDANFTGSGTFAWNGLPFTIGNYPDISITPFPSGGFNGDFAQFWFACGQSLLDGGGDIPAATRHLFYTDTLEPVDLGTDGSTPTGTAPTIFMERRSGEDPSAFIVNKGTGGAFVSTGTDEVIASETNPPTQGISWPLPIIVGDPIVGQTLSYTLSWPRDIVSITQSWRRTTNNAEIGTGTTLVVPGGDLIGLNIYLIVYVTDALGFWPNLSSAEGTYCGPVTT